MRFHIGFSKRISWKWIILIIGGLAAFFGFGNHAVLAYTSVTNTPTSAGVSTGSGGISLNVTSRTGGILGDNYYIYFPGTTCGGVDCDPVFDGYAYWNYPAKNLCPNGGMIHYKFSYFTRTTDPPVVFPTNNFSTNYSGSNARLSYDSTNKKWTVSLDVPNNQTYQIRFGFENNYNTNYYFISSAVQKNWEYSCDYSLAESTDEIISNNNANTQKITDKLEKKCNNLANIRPQFTSKDGLTISNNNGIITINGTTNNSGHYYFSDLGTFPAGTYYFNVSGQKTGVNFYVWDNTNLTAYANNGGTFTLTDSARLSLTLQTINSVVTNQTNSISLFKDSNESFCAFGSTISLIDSNNQIIQGQQDINNSINNSDVQSGVSHGGNMFTNTNINDHGVSTIVTAPVRLLQGMLNSGSSCNDLILFSSIFGQNKLVTMPSGCILWNQAPSEIVSIYHIVVFGFLGYFVLIDIWKTITDVLDPERKNDYVMDL